MEDREAYQVDNRWVGQIKCQNIRGKQSDIWVEAQGLRCWSQATKVLG